MSTEPTTELIEGEMSAPPVVASVPTESVEDATERIPAELLEICRDDMKQANRLAAEADRLDAVANGKRAGAEALAAQVRRRLTKKMNLLPVDDANLDTGIVTRGKPDEVRP